MAEKWLEDFFGKKRAHKIKDTELASELGWHPKYLSAVLNGHRTPKHAKEKLESALSAIVNRKHETG